MFFINLMRDKISRLLRRDSRHVPAETATGERAGEVHAIAAPHAAVLQNEMLVQLQQGLPNAWAGNRALQWHRALEPRGEHDVFVYVPIPIRISPFN